MAHPKADGGYSIDTTYRGGMAEMANGTVVIDLVNANAKTTHTLIWENISTAARDIILTAFATVDDSSAAFTSPENGSYTVTRDPGSPSLKCTSRLAKSGLVWNVTMSLRQA